jgi:hypothetical protein
MHVRLIREVLAPTGNGPGNGQYALQRALQRRIDEGVDWLRIGGQPRPGELPWYWSWQDRPDAARWSSHGRPFVQGPNMVFLNSRAPRADALERRLLDTPACRLWFTESAWYRDLIAAHRGPESIGPIVLWPYPIDPRPTGPAPSARWDLLLYLKNGFFPGLADALRARFSQTAVIRYRNFQRTELWEIARQARCCAYLADDDRGPLALSEMLLCGCPTVGLATGVPFVQTGRTGVVLSGRNPTEWIAAVKRCHGLDRPHVAATAAAMFDTRRIVDTVLAALDEARRGTC